MLTSIWLVSVAALLVADVRTGALQQNDPVHRCFSCDHNKTTCDVTSASAVACPMYQPLCATTAFAPNFTSTFSCARVTKTPCSLTHTPESGLQFTCVCSEDLCNAPFASDLENHLINFSSTNFSNLNTTDSTEAFFKFANLTADKIYKIPSVHSVQTTKGPKQNNSLVTSLASKLVSARTLTHAIEVVMPRAEALKHVTTAPSDDDEDDSEGSGNYEENKSQRPGVSDPAAPSSFLPAHENKAVHLLANLLVATPALLFFIA